LLPNEPNSHEIHLEGSINNARVQKRVNNSPDFGSKIEVCWFSHVMFYLVRFPNIIRRMFA
jgi:hypothetical protein